MSSKKRRNKLTESAAIDKFLLQRGLERKEIARDGSCLFRAVAEQAWLTQTKHEELRRLCAYHIRTNAKSFQEFLTISVDEYSYKLTNCGLWGGEMELVALAQLLRKKIVVYSYREDQHGKVKEMCFEGNSSSNKKKNKKMKDEVLLAYFDNNHYDSVWERKERYSTAYCQSIVYEMIFDGVFGDKIPNKTRQQLIYIRENDFNSLSVSKELHQLCDKYGDEVVKALAPNVYCNTALDVERRERQSLENTDSQIAASMQFQVGQHCQVQVTGRTHRGEIVNIVTSDNGGTREVEVLLHENGKRCTVPYTDILMASRGRYNSRRRDDRGVDSQHTTKSWNDFRSRHPSASTSASSSSKQPAKQRPVSASTQARQDALPTCNRKGLLGEYPKEQIPVSPQLPNITRMNSPRNNKSATDSSGRPPLTQTTKGPGPVEGTKTTYLKPGKSIPATVKTHIIGKPENSHKQEEPIPKTKNWASQSNGRSDGSSTSSSSSSSDDNATPPPTKEVLYSSSFYKRGPHQPHVSMDQTQQQQQQQQQQQSSFSNQRPVKRGERSMPQASQWSGWASGRTSNQEEKDADKPPPMLPAPVARPRHNGAQPDFSHQQANRGHAVPVASNQPTCSSGEGGSRFSDSTMYMTHLLGHAIHPDILTQNQLSAITDAPECEWPNLNLSNLGDMKGYSFIDGPPAQATSGPNSTRGGGDNMNNLTMGIPMPYWQFFMHEIQPPVHLLQCAADESKTKFLLEYAQKCLRVYSKYITNPEVEDCLSDLLCMQLDDLVISASQQSIGTSYTSHADSEVTDDQLQGMEQEEETREFNEDLEDSEHFPKRKLNPEEEQYISKIQQGQSRNPLQMAISISPVSIESENIFDLNTSQSDEPASNLLHHQNDQVSQQHIEPIQETTTGLPQDEVLNAGGSKSAMESMDQEADDPQAKPPAMMPPMVPPHLMMPRLPHPYYMPYFPYPPPYGFPPGPWGYMPPTGMPMMFPPMLPSMPGAFGQPTPVASNPQVEDTTVTEETASEETTEGERAKTPEITLTDSDGAHVSQPSNSSDERFIDTGSTSSLHKGSTSSSAQAKSKLSPSSVPQSLSPTPKPQSLSPTPKSQSTSSAPIPQSLSPVPKQLPHSPVSKPSLLSPSDSGPYQAFSQKSSLTSSKEVVDEQPSSNPRVAVQVGSEEQSSTTTTGPAKGKFKHDTSRFKRNTHTSNTGRANTTRSNKDTSTTSTGRDTSTTSKAHDNSTTSTGRDTSTTSKARDTNTAKTNQDTSTTNRERDNNLTSTVREKKFEREHDTQTVPESQVLDQDKNKSMRNETEPIDDSAGSQQHDKKRSTYTENSKPNRGYSNHYRGKNHRYRGGGYVGGHGRQPEDKHQNNWDQPHQREGRGKYSDDHDHQPQQHDRQRQSKDSYKPRQDFSQHKESQDRRSRKGRAEDNESTAREEGDHQAQEQSNYRGKRRDESAQFKPRYVRRKSPDAQENEAVGAEHKPYRSGGDWSRHDGKSNHGGFQGGSRYYTRHNTRQSYSHNQQSSKDASFRGASPASASADTDVAPIPFSDTSHCNLLSPKLALCASPKQSYPHYANSPQQESCFPLFPVACTDNALSGTNTNIHIASDLQSFKEDRVSYTSSRYDT